MRHATAQQRAVSMSPLCRVHVALVLDEWEGLRDEVLVGLGLRILRYTLLRATAFVAYRLESPVPRGCSPSLYRLRPFGCRPGHFTGKFGLPRDVSRLSTTADLRVLALDLHSESPCVVSEAFLPVVLSCSSTCAALACVPFHRLETVAPAEVLDELDALLVATNGAAAIIETNKQMQALVSIITELQTRLEFLECAPAKA
ncbi:uncharacterized protein LOC34618850 [Cyclospora cayetanensis]|uniref:Uncharacterized protein LOC34618850 n=1 Tax=Cyclospora cayetanensis TaxID=88456 RepID=A0A6P6RYS5_9EIME|nr:uncharacterized protein LOC34618850 [Cyclospora cayetanensis]